MTEDLTPPNDHDAEKAVLGAMLLSAEAIGDVVEALRGEDFYRPAHEIIFDVITDMYSSGEAVDANTVNAELQRRKVIRQVGGAPYLHTLISGVLVVANVTVYAERVRDLAMLRRLAEAATKVRQMAYEGADDATLIVDRAEAEILGAIPRRTAEDYRRAGDLVEPTIDYIDSLAHGGREDRVPTGFYDLDDLTGGLIPGQMIVVAGRPAMGKSTLGLDFARSASLRHGMCSVVFSLEMTREEIMMRMLAAEGKVGLANIRSGDLRDDQWIRLANAGVGIADAPLYIDDSPHLTMTEIRAKARRLRARADLRLVVIDYLQLMTSGKKVENRQTEVSEFSRQVKLLAKELAVPVVALSQLNRGPEQRTSKRPLLSDLRESGSIEQDSDLVILLHREDAYDMDSNRPGEADFIVAKHRNGPTRDIPVAAQLHYSRFVDLAHG